jgi:hypothetical protein
MGASPVPPLYVTRGVASSLHRLAGYFPLASRVGMRDNIRSRNAPGGACEDRVGGRAWLGSMRLRWVE